MNDFSSMDWKIGFQQLFNQARRPVLDDREFRQQVSGTHTRGELRGRQASATEHRGRKRANVEVKKEDALMTSGLTDRTPPSPKSYPIANTPNTPTTPTPVPQPNVDTCRCDIGYHCTHASHAPPDPRLLLSDTDRRQERAEAEFFERLRGTASLHTKIVNEAQLLEICKVIDAFCGAKTVAHRCEAVRSLRSWIVNMEFATVPDGIPQNVVRTEVLPRLRRFLLQEIDIRRQKQLPAYIEEELTVIMRKWTRGDWDGNPRRGLLEKRNAVDPNYALKRSGHCFGANQLVNGQMFGDYAEMRCHGVHPTSQAGISGNQQDGAYSVVMSCIGKKQYEDVDKGYVVEYMGTFAKDVTSPRGTARPTDHTKILQRSRNTGRPIRLIRKIKLAHIAGPHRKEAYRYDGLYRISHAKIVDPARQAWSFTMERLPHQGPLRPLPVPNGNAFFI